MLTFKVLYLPWGDIFATFAALVGEKLNTSHSVMKADGTLVDVQITKNQRENKWRPSDCRTCRECRDVFCRGSHFCFYSQKKGKHIDNIKNAIRAELKFHPFTTHLHIDGGFGDIF